MSTWSSAFIPFCAYKSDLNFSINPMSSVNYLNYPTCSSFLPIMSDGQLCYQLRLNEPSGQGKKNELMLLLDYNEDRSLQMATPQEKESWSPSKMNLGAVSDSFLEVAAKVKVQTLSPFTSF